MTIRVTMTVNGEPLTADDVWEGESLLHVLRERLGLPGSKNACEQGECGSCTVLLGGEVVCACLVGAGQAEGADIVTVEGLGDGEQLATIQQTFVAAGAVVTANVPAYEIWGGVPARKLSERPGLSE